MTFLRYAVCCVILLVFTTTGADLARAEDTPRPKYSSPLRQNEDWSVLADRAPDDFWDPIKHISLGEDGAAWVSFGGEVRARFENWNRFAFATPNDDDFTLFRALLHADLHLSDQVRVFAQGKTAHVTDRNLPGGRRTLDVDSLDVLQLFADIVFPLDEGDQLTLRGGRQSLSFGKQRLVSPLPWGNTIRSWDGVSLIWKRADWNITAFWTQFAPVDKYDPNEADKGNQFYGIYATGPAPVGDQGGLDLYWFGHDRDMVAFNGTAGSEERYTAGGRWWAPVGDSSFDVELEGAYQFGEVGTGDIDAYMIAALLGYDFTDSTARAWLGFDYASGDDAAAGNVETFSQLSPLGHAYFGYMDFLGRQNIIDLSAGFSLKPTDRTTLALTGHRFWVANNNDAIYTAGGGVLRAGGLSGSDLVGSEVDLTLKYKHDVHTTFLLGYSHFFPGDVIEDSGPSGDADFAYFQVQYVF
ncbi:MAG: alginate export family protein [Phycisphaerae bacterium]|nr:alginate export family protein [Phycisphaerae bacterium]